MVALVSECAVYGAVGGYMGACSARTYALSERGDAGVGAAVDTGAADSFAGVSGADALLLSYGEAMQSGCDGGF